MEPHRPISEEAFHAWLEKFNKPEAGKAVVETSAGDRKLIEELLGLPAGSFGASSITVRGDLKACPKCNRQTSFLDIVKDGVAFHGKEFVSDVVQGKRGRVYNPNPPRTHKCYACGATSPVDVGGYQCSTGYGCGG